MAGSFKKIDYRLRPAKHAERVMLCDLFRRMRFAPPEDYQYVGFGSVAFIDFRLVHRNLGIREMISIEETSDENEQDRFGRNKPYAGLALHFGHSSEILPTLNFQKKSIVWLDYDGLLTRSMATDMAIVAENLTSGSFIGATFTSDFPTVGDRRTDELARLKGQFPEYVPDDTRPQAFDGGRIGEFGRTTLGSLLEQALANADAGKPPEQARRAHQVCFFRYSDGAPMVTVGWIVAAVGDQALLEASHLSALPFFRDGAAAFRIKIPLVTPHEVREMERRLPEWADADDLNWIPESERTAFYGIYRYLPHFAAMEPT